jgi:uncharacterized protein (DUF58 family)
MRANGPRKGGPPFCPTAAFAGLMFVLCAMWYAAASQNNAAAYLLLFLLMAVFLVSVPHTLLNLGGLAVKAESVNPTFAGQEASLAVEIMNRSGATRHGIILSLPNPASDAERIDNIPAGKATRATVRFPALDRGEHEIGRLRLSSVYPLGFLRMAKQFPAPQRYVVYPKPRGNPKLPVGGARSAQSSPRPEIGEGDDFAGVRPYVLGESQRHIDWKAVARGHALKTKQFTADVNSLLYLDFAAVGPGDLEQRLSQLALWVIEAERARRPYGLRLPSAEIRPSLGELHFHRCLRALALFK